MKKVIDFKKECFPITVGAGGESDQKQFIIDKINEFEAEGWELLRIEWGPHTTWSHRNGAYLWFIKRE